jgi:AsmA protein
MGKLLKILAAVAGVLVLLLVAAAVIIPLVVDPNDYKEEIVTKVKEATGRDLKIQGDIGLSVFPWLGLELGAVELSNAQGFGEAPFAAVSEAAVRVKIRPLLDKRLEADTVTLKGLRLNLAKAKDGRTNWDDLTAAGKPTEPKAEKKAEAAPAGAPLAALAIGGIEITDARLSWQDEVTGQQFVVEQLNLETGTVVPGRPVELELAFQVESKAPALRAGLRLTGSPLLDMDKQRVTIEKLLLELDAQGEMLQGKEAKVRLESGVDLDLAAQTLALKGLRLNGSDISPVAGLTLSRVDLSGDPQVDLAKQSLAIDKLLLEVGAEGELLQGEPLAARLESGVALDMMAQTLALGGLQLKVADLVISGDLKGSSIMEAPAFSGDIRLAEFDLRKLLAARRLPVPETADPNVLSKVAFATGLKASDKGVALGNLKLTLDDSTLEGNLSVKEFAKPAIAFHLAVDAIDLDRYLPPPAEREQEPARAEAPKAAPTDAPKVADTPKAAAKAAPGAEPELLPVETLRQLNVDGLFRVGRLKVKKLKMQDAEVSVKAREGHIQVGQQIKQFYDGSLQGRTLIDVRGAEPQLQVEENLAGVQAGPLLKDYMGEDKLTGVGRFQAKLDTRGNTDSALRKNLGGDLSLRFENGAVKGINVAQVIRENWAKVQGQPVVASSEPQQTDFSELSGTAQISKGVLTNQDLMAKSPLLRIDGKGQVDLVQETLDYTLTTTIVGSLEGQGGKEITDLKGAPVPVRLSGPLADPKPSVNMEELAQRLAKTKVKEKVDEKIQEKLQDKVPAELQDKLKGLFR